MNDIIKIICPVENLGVLIDGVIKILKHAIKNQEGGFLRALLAHSAASLMPPIASSLVKAIGGRGVRRVGIRHMGKNF